jgi:hypothetical protein
LTTTRIDYEDAVLRGRGVPPEPGWWYTGGASAKPGPSLAAPAPDEGGQPVATPADSEAAQEPAPAILERLSYFDAGGRLVPREAAQFAVIRDFDDDGNVISFMTERLHH